MCVSERGKEGGGEREKKSEREKEGERGRRERDKSLL